jgi:hypothetical protein
MHARHPRLRPRIDISRKPVKVVGLALTVCVLAALIAAGSVALLGTSGRSAGATAAAAAAPLPTAGGGPAAPPVRVCGNAAILGGGSLRAPAHAVRVPAGDDSGVNLGLSHTTYWFAPGVHTLGGNDYTQIIPGSWSTYIGAPGAILDGQRTNFYAFGGYATHVTVSYLTIEDFGVLGGNQDQGVVNEDSAAWWTIDHSTVIDNAGAGVMLGSDNTLSYDCLESNEQYGFNAYSPKGPVHLLLDHDEIADNDTYNWETRDPGCGCSGGGKFWDVNGAVITDNWIHGNLSAGLWADTDNTGFELTGNYFSDNYSYGLTYEISYNALIENNTFVRNGLGAGPENGGFPTSAIYISESGSDSRVPGPYGQVFLIAYNTFTDNWGGVILWENSNRFCNSPANTSSGACTLVNPAEITSQSCNAQNIMRQPYYSDCRWKTQNVMVEHNIFDLNLGAVGSSCTPTNQCGFQGLFSEYGTYPSWSPYQRTIVEQHITFSQNNHFFDNIYNGPWQFMALQQGDVVTWGQWRGSQYHQDKGSSLSATSGSG